MAGWAVDLSPMDMRVDDTDVMQQSPANKLINSLLDYSLGSWVVLYALSCNISPNVLLSHGTCPFISANDFIAGQPHPSDLNTHQIHHLNHNIATIIYYFQTDTALTDIPYHFDDDDDAFCPIASICIHTVPRIFILKTTPNPVLLNFAKYEIFT